MDGSDSGTPNPLNPMSGGTGGRDAQRFTAPETPTIQPVQPTQSMPEMREASPTPRPISQGVIDPMMRSVSHHNTPTPEVDTMIEESFDSLAVDDDSLNMLAQEVATTAAPSRAEVVQTEAINTDLSGLDGSNLVAKDSIVESIGDKKSKKKFFTIGAIALLVIALICGITALIIIMVSNNSDPVSKAIEKMLGGGMPTIVTAQGKIEVSTEATTSSSTNNSVGVPNTVIDFNGTFDTTSNMNKVSADIAMNYNDNQTVPITIEEMRNKTGDTYFKISGLTNIVNTLNSSALTTSGTDSTDASASASLETNCISDVGCVGSECTNGCDDGAVVYNPFSILSRFGGLLEAADNTWILISDNFGDEMEGLNIFDNSSTCLINAFSTLPQYGKDIASKYKANPFIESSTDNLGIAKKTNTLYRLTFNSNKLSAFSNSLGNNGFVNELNACMGGTASNTGTSATMIEEIFSKFPAMYAEIDNDSNFTRFYFDINMGDSETSTAATADISLSYPREFKISEPTDYIPMSQLLSETMSSLFNSTEVVPSY